MDGLDDIISACFFYIIEREDKLLDSMRYTFRIGTSHQNDSSILLLMIFIYGTLVVAFRTVHREVRQTLVLLRRGTFQMELFPV